MITAFFAYQSPTRSGDFNNSEAIKRAISILSLKNIRAISWEDLSNSGKLVNTEILKVIDESEYFVADLTHLNFNVMFELGYAIGKKKYIIILLNKGIEGAAANYHSTDILRQIGYTEFSNAQDIVAGFEKSIESKPSDLLESNLTNISTSKIDIFYIRSKSRGQIELDVHELINNLICRVISDDSSEVEYRSLKWYVSNIFNSNSIILHCMPTNLDGSKRHNAINSLYAGIGLGLEKLVLLFAPAQFEAPIDYTDLLLSYTTSRDACEKIQTWVDVHIMNNDTVRHVYDEHVIDLLKLGIGYDVAENEKDALASYFVETKAFLDAKQSDKSLIVGKKGTGKTAIYIMLEKYFLEGDENFVVSLKPESSELLQNIDITRMYNTFAQEKSFFHAIWRSVIYSKILLLICERLKSNSLYTYNVNNINIIEFAKINDANLHDHFIETISRVYRQIQSSDDNVLNNYYINFLNPMRALIKTYTNERKYWKIIILADNLDQAWDSRSDLKLQSQMLISLYNVTDDINRDFGTDIRFERRVQVVLLLRKDIFEQIVKYAIEPDKLFLSQYEIDWELFPDLLKKVIEKRFIYVLGLDDNDDVNQIWIKFFNLRKKDLSAFEIIRSHCLSRPRDLLYFIGQLFESAFNNGRDKVCELDLEYAINRYNLYTYYNVISELKSEFPQIDKVLDAVHQKYTGKFNYGEMPRILTECRMPDTNQENFMNLLISYNQVTVTNDETGEILKFHNEALRQLDGQTKRFLVFNIKVRGKVSIKFRY